MKTWLKRFKWMAAITVGLSVAMLTGIKLHAAQPDDADYEPEICALCGSGMKYHAPVILDLSTGEVAEMQVYEPHPYLVGEIAEEQTTGYMGLSMSAGIMMYTNPGRSCRATLPENNEKMKESLYCGACRAVLSAAATKGYVLVDMYDPEHIRAYPIANGKEYSIRGYKASIAVGGTGASSSGGDRGTVLLSASDAEH